MLITIPDVLRDRFRSIAFGLISVSLIVFFMTFNLIAQFKGGSTILKTLLGPIDAFTSSAASLPEWIGDMCSQGNEYLVCLVVFGVAVIVYTTYGGFHAVVWTDVMQGVVMVIGVVIMLPLAINQAGYLARTDDGAGLEQVTRRTQVGPDVAAVARLDHQCVARREAARYKGHLLCGVIA